MKPAAILFLLAALAVAGCNTVQGFGRDVNKAGDAVTDTAAETERKL